jgi:hypothetical protein
VVLGGGRRRIHVHLAMGKATNWLDHMLQRIHAFPLWFLAPPFFRFVFLLRFLDSFVRSFQYPVALPVTLLHCNVSIWDLLGDDPSTEERSRAVYLGIGVCDVTSHLDMCMCDLEHMYEKKKNTLNSEVVAKVS